jgi:hypothetical protein
MYEHNSRQIAFHDDPQMFGSLLLKADNRWVKLAGLIPWSRVEEAYRRNFRGNRGERAKSARLALACLIVKEQLQLSDRDTVQMIQENPFLHEARRKLEEMMDTHQTERTQAKPRNYREKAHKDYHRFGRNRRPTKQQIRTALTEAAAVCFMGS